MRSLYLVPLIVSLCATPALAAGKLSYGSRAGMEVTVVAVENLGTERAVIRARHTREDARAFCTEYLMNKSRECVDRTLRETILSDTIRANCRTGVFTTFYGETVRFRGPNPKYRRDNSETKYVLVRNGEVLDISSASGYDVSLAQFAALCPGRVW
jgi:hypothetical protein